MVEHQRLPNGSVRFTISSAGQLVARASHTGTHTDGASASRARLRPGPSGRDARARQHAAAAHGRRVAASGTTREPPALACDRVGIFSCSRRRPPPRPPLSAARARAQARRARPLPADPVLRQHAFTTAFILSTNSTGCSSIDRGRAADARQIASGSGCIPDGLAIWAVSRPWARRAAPARAEGRDGDVRGATRPSSTLFSGAIIRGAGPTSSPSGTSTRCSHLATALDGGGSSACSRDRTLGDEPAQPVPSPGPGRATSDRSDARGGDSAPPRDLHDRAVSRRESLSRGIRDRIADFSQRCPRGGAMPRCATPSSATRRCWTTIAAAIRTTGSTSSTSGGERCRRAGDVMRALASPCDRRC